ALSDLAPINALDHKAVELQWSAVPVSVEPVVCLMLAPCINHYGNGQNWPRDFLAGEFCQYRGYHPVSWVVIRPIVSQLENLPVPVPSRCTPVKYPAEFR